QDRHNVEDTHQREVHELLVRTFMRLIIVSGGGGVFDGAVVGHGGSSPSRSKSGRRSGVSAIAAEGQPKRNAAGLSLWWTAGDRPWRARRLVARLRPQL